MRQRREYHLSKQKRAEKQLMAQRVKRLNKFGNLGRGAMRESVRTVEAWDKVKRILKETPQWTGELERSFSTQLKQEVFAGSRIACRFI